MGGPFAVPDKERKDAGTEWQRVISVNEVYVKVASFVSNILTWTRRLVAIYYKHMQR